jgi:hypothetical protein
MDTAKCMSDIIKAHKTQRMTKTAAARVVAEKLGIRYKTVLIIASGGYAGKRLQSRMRELMRQPRQGRHGVFDCGPFTISERKKVLKKSTPKERRVILLRGIGEEP